MIRCQARFISGEIHRAAQHKEPAAEGSRKSNPHRIVVRPIAHLMQLFRNRIHPGTYGQQYCVSDEPLITYWQKTTILQTPSRDQRDIRMCIFRKPNDTVVSQISKRGRHVHPLRSDLAQGSTYLHRPKEQLLPKPHALA